MFHLYNPRKYRKRQPLERTTSGNAQPDKKFFFPYIINFDKTTRGWSGLLQNYLCARYQVMK